MKFDELYNELMVENTDSFDDGGGESKKDNVLDFSNQWDEYKKYDSFEDALENFDKSPTIENLAKIALEEEFPLSFTHPDLWENVQEIAKKALEIVKDKSSLELERLKEEPKTPEELFIVYIYNKINTSNKFIEGGKAYLMRLLKKIIKEDRWEMLMQNRENVYLKK